jgi:hypothetical protein
MSRWQSIDYTHLFFLPKLKFGCYAVWQQIDLKYGKHNNICENSKSTENIFMKLEIWIDGSMEIMHVILSSTL